MVRYINRIDYCSAQLLTPVVNFPPAQTAYATSYLPFENLPLAALAALEVSEEIQDGERVFTSKLTAVLKCSFDVPSRPIALRLTCTDGTQLPLGTSRRPFPLATVTIAHPNKASEQSAYTLTATWTAPTPALTLVD